MTCSCDVLGRSLVLLSKNSGSNHFTSIGTNDVATQDLVGLLLYNELDETIGVLVGLRSRVGSEGELSDLVFDTSGLELLLVLADPGDFRVGVDD